MNFDGKGERGHQTVLGALGSMALLVLMVLVALEVVQANKAEVAPVEYYQNPEPTTESVERLESSDVDVEAPMRGQSLKKENIKYFLYVFDTTKKAAVAYDASLKAYVRIQFVATKATKGKAPVRKVYEPQACSEAAGGKGMAIHEGGYPVEQSSLLCSSAFDDAVLFGKSDDGGSTKLSLEVTLCSVPEKGKD